MKRTNRTMTKSHEQPIFSIDANPENTQYSIITEGKWGDTPWQFVIDSTHPEPTLCTAAFCIVTYRGKLVLIEHQNRGFEFTGGHIDPNESTEITIAREVKEEALAVVEQPKIFGYKKISPVLPIPHRDKPGEFYPFPYSYVPYFYAEAVSLINDDELAQDVKGVRLASYTEALQLLTPDQNHDKILDYLVSHQMIKLR